MEEEIGKVKWFKKNATNGIAVVVMIIVPVVTAGINNIAPIINAIRKPQLPEIAMSHEQDKVSEKKSDPSPLPDSCYIIFPNSQFDVKTRQDRIKVNGDTLTPSGAGSTWEGMLWFNDVVKTNFDHISIEYSIASEKNTDKPPSLIWALGRTIDEGIFQTISQLWIPEYSEREGQKYLQLAGFSKIEDYENGQLVRQAPIQLPDGVATKQTDSLTAKSMEITGSKLLTQFTYKYLWNKAGQANPFPFTEEITFPFSDLKNSNENLNLGVGTYVGNKIKVVRLEVCY